MGLLYRAGTALQAPARNWRLGSPAPFLDESYRRSFNSDAPYGDKLRWADVQGVQVNLEFSGQIWYWKGPAPFYFVTVPEEECVDLAAASAIASYGWGMIPVTARIGRTEWKTSLFPKDGQYIVPVKVAVRRAERLAVDDTVTVGLEVDI